MTRPHILALFCGLALAACADPAVPPDAPAPPRLRLEADLGAQAVTRRPEDRPGTCWHQDIRPALFETVTEQVIETPPTTDASGRVTRPAQIRSETRQRQLRPRQTIWFPVPCAADGAGTPGFNATLQRALKARGFYGGPVTGELDPATIEATRRFQALQGLDSGTLSIEAARTLGIVAAPPPGRR